MKTRILALARGALLVWGGLSLLGVVGIASLVAYRLGPGIQDKTDSASVRDVRFVLNWCRLGDERIEKVVHSHVSGRSFNGDHLDAYAIKITHVDLAELTQPPDLPETAWHRGDHLPKVLDDAVEFATEWVDLPWFPSREQLRSSEFYIYPQSIFYRGLRPNAAELIFIRPSDHMVFYFGGKM